MPLKNEEKTDKKIPTIADQTENSSTNINCTSAQNFHKSQKNFTQGITLKDYLKGANYSNELPLEKENTIKKFRKIIPARITEKTEISLDNSEKNYLDSSFEINESDEDLYNNSDSNSTFSKNNTSEKKKKKNYKNSDNIIEPQNQEQEDLRNKIKVKYTNKKIIKKHNSQKLEENEIIPLRDYEKKNSLKLSKEKREPNVKEFEENNEKRPQKDIDEISNNDQRENRMKNSNKQPKKNYNSQSPPHSNVLQSSVERRNFSKDTFGNYSHEEKLHNYSSKENIENHIAYRNSYDPNKTQFLMSGNLKEKKEETKFGNFYNNNNNGNANEFNKSSYNTKSRLTLNEFYKNQSKYQDFGNPIGPPPKMKAWNSLNNDSEFEKKYCDREKIKEKMKNEDLNLLTKYASKFKLNQEECINP